MSGKNFGQRAYLGAEFTVDAAKITVTVYSIC